MRSIELNERQEKILDIVKKNAPITGDHIAEMLEVTRATLRPDLAVLTMSGYLDAKPRVGYTFKFGRETNTINRWLAQYRVRDLNSLPVVVKDTCSIYDAIVTLFTEDAGSIFVLDRENYLSGVISRKDLLKNTIGHSDIHRVPVSVIMTRMPNITVTTPDESVVDATRKIVQHEVDSLPVVKVFMQDNGEERYEVIGRFSKTNVARFLLDLSLSKDCKEG